uniref:Uncharacterized protein n=1 Tax=viral metagenome TaxID=1070528 RepID=A0A6C0EB14_9ZZZZ
MASFLDMNEDSVKMFESGGSSFLEKPEAEKNDNTDDDDVMTELNEVLSKESPTEIKNALSKMPPQDLLNLYQMLQQMQSAPNPNKKVYSSDPRERLRQKRLEKLSERTSKYAKNVKQKRDDDKKEQERKKKEKEEQDKKEAEEKNKIQEDEIDEEL